MTEGLTDTWMRVGTLDELKSAEVKLVSGGAHPISVWWHDGQVHAVDNRCPHLGFPLDKGTVRDGILTCHWHQARFDLCSGCTFDLWADDVPAYDTRVRDGIVFVATTPRHRPDAAFHQRRLIKGMQQNIALLQAKSLTGLLRGGAPFNQILRDIALYAARNQEAATGVVEMAIVANLQPVLSEETMYYMLLRAAETVANASANAKRRPREPLEAERYSAQLLKRWFVQWIGVRDREGAERVLLTALRQGMSQAQLTDLLLGAISQRVYNLQGHLLDFANKQFELLDKIGWDHAADILPLGLGQLAEGRGAEESSGWHHPINLIEPLREVERDLPALLQDRPAATPGASGRDPALIDTLLGDDPLKILKALWQALRDGVAPAQLSKQVAYAAAMRLARFAKSNEVGDWFNPQHTFTFANAVHQSVKRSPTPDVVRSILHAALSVYMDRFLNVPPAKLPGEAKGLDDLPRDAAELRKRLLASLDERSNIDGAARIVSRYLRLGHASDELFETLAFATVREDLDFHTLQVLEAGYQQFQEWKGGPEAEHILIGVTRNLAAVCPTRRGRLKIATTALRLQRGDHIYEEEPADA